MLSLRKKKILSAVVDGYIEKASPVSSKEIQKNCLQDCSSATIRNELSALESMGYLIQPHVSAGRIPSEKAFRFYVNELTYENCLTDEETSFIENKLLRKHDSLDDVIQQITDVVSQITNYTSVVVKADMADKITAIKLLDLSNGQMLVVIVTETRVLKDGMVDISDEFDELMLLQAQAWLNRLFVGKHISQFLNFTYPYTLTNDQFKLNSLFKKIIDVLRKQSLANGMDVTICGEHNIFQHSEYSDVANVQKFLSEVGSKDKMAQVFTDDGGQDGFVTIKIGSSENAPEGCSVVTSRVALGANIAGSIGVIGPVRMNYKKVLAVLDKISNIIIDMMGKE
ncbi:MAG: heat-inducible transcription repressor HrcA [Clostridia bacterium]|nr:heat-inducible transcription repressor HrcA [Clostridia bacterium]